YPEIEQAASSEHYLQINQIFHNQRDGTFRETTQEAGPAFQVRHAARGAAFGDIDNDGNLDILVNNNDGPPLLIWNPGGSGNHFRNLQLIGDPSRKDRKTRSSRDAIGAQVWVTAGGLRQRRDVKNAGSYLSSSEPRLHFGLGKATLVEKVEVR